jgi:hypothetical protein
MKSPERSRSIGGLARFTFVLAAAAPFLSSCEGSLGGQLGGSAQSGSTVPGNDTNSPGNDPGSQALCTDADIKLASVPLRRLTRFEYNNTVRDLDLLADETVAPANALPAEDLGNGFGNDTTGQSVSSFLAEQYSAVAETIALGATASPERLGVLAPCAQQISETSDVATTEACVRSWLTDFVPRAFRRPVEEGEVDGLLELFQILRADASFAVGVAGVLEAILISPEFLYRVELGDPDSQRPEWRRPNGYEMASRLSYLFWGTSPDDELIAAAAGGVLATNQGVIEQAERLLDDAKARSVIRFFFDNLLPISSLSQLERDPERYRAYSPLIGASMREETQRVLEHEIFEGQGTWSAAITADYSFLNGPLAQFYGVPGVEGDEFQKVDYIDTTQRLGVLTHAGVLAGTIHSNETNPVVRGHFILEKLMCMHIPLPASLADEITPPDPYSGDTARERFSAHSNNPACVSCHELMDPVGFALENYDAIGQWRDTENGVTIDATGAVPGMEGTTDGPVELVRQIAASEATQDCFAYHWMNFAYGRTLGGTDNCMRARLGQKFRESGYDIKTLLVELTQTEDFLYLPLKEGAL